MTFRTVIVIAATPLLTAAALFVKAVHNCAYMPVSRFLNWKLSEQESEIVTVQRLAAHLKNLEACAAPLSFAESAARAAHIRGLRNELGYSIQRLTGTSKRQVNASMRTLNMIHGLCNWISGRCCSLIRILEEPSAPTFYAELLIWIFIPSQYAECMMGDLLEQATAIQNYCGLTITAAKGIVRFLWNRIERLAALVFVIEEIRHWLRK